MRVCRSGIILFAAIALTTNRRAGAQSRGPRVVSSVDVSATNVWYADSIRADGVSVNPAIRLDWTRATLGGSASFTRLAHGGTSAQASLAPSVFAPNAGIFTAEVAADVGGSTHDDGARTGQLLGLARVYAIGTRYGGWAGGGLGRTWDGVVWRGVRQAEVGAWMNHAGMTALASVTPVVVEDTIRYTDVQTAVRYPKGSFELGITGGLRAGTVGPAIGGPSRGWGNVSVVAWLSRRLALVGSAGSYPVDLTQGYPGGRFVSVALRIASRTTRLVEEEIDSRPSSRDDDVTDNAGTSAIAFDVRTPVTGSTRRELRVHAPSANTVEIMGDFTAWQPVALHRGADGWWTLARDLAVGTYQMNVRVDGGSWLAPPGLLTTRDEFGGIAGILPIE